MKKNINCPDGKNRSFHTIVFIFPMPTNPSFDTTVFIPRLPGEREKNWDWKKKRHPTSMSNLFMIHHLKNLAGNHGGS